MLRFLQGPKGRSKKKQHKRAIQLKYKNFYIFIKIKNMLKIHILYKYYQNIESLFFKICMSCLSPPP